MKLIDIKIGQTEQELKKIIRKTDNIILQSLPSFVATKYKLIENLDTKEKIYVLFENGILIDMITNSDKVINWNESRNNLNFILRNLT